MTINYVVGDATKPIGSGNKIIAHICNNVGAWGGGFVLAISRKWPEPEARYRTWSKFDTTFVLGSVQMVQVEPHIHVANIVGQHSVGFQDGPPIRYEAVREGLIKVASEARALGASIHMPRIGCGLAGGRWDIIKALIDETLDGLQVTVYDLPK